MLLVASHYIENMKIKHTQLGSTYLDKMVANIETIFTKINETQNYEALELINNVITWYFKCLAFKYNLIKIQPQLPDYIVSEINDIANSLISFKRRDDS